MGLIVPLVFFVAGAFAAKRCLNISLYKAFSAFMIFVVLTIYLSGVLVSSFLPGLLLSVALVLLFLSWAICGLLKNRFNETGFKAELKRDLVPLIFFLVIYLFISLIDFNRSFTAWDEWSHWGVMAKELLRLDDFYLIDESVLTVHKDYPPFLGLLEYAYCMVASFGSYEEAYLYRAVHLLLFSLLLVPFEGIEKANKGLCFACSLLIPAISLCVLSFGPCGQETVLTVYNDVTLAALIAVSLYMAVFACFDKKGDIVYFSLILSSILLCKQIGIAFFVLAVFAWLLRFLLVDRHFYSHENCKKSNVVLLIAGLLIPILLSSAWSQLVADANVDQQFKLSSINVHDFLDIIFGSASVELYRSQVFANYVSSIVSDSFISYPFSLTFIGLCAAMLALIVLVPVLFRKKLSRFDLCIVVTFFVGFVGYACSILLLYLFCFDEYEAVHLASFSRYLGMYALSMAVFSFLYGVSVLCKTERGSRRPHMENLSAVFCVAVLICSTSALSNALQSKSKQITPSTEYTANELAPYVSDSSGLYFVDQQGDGGALFQIAYYLNPVRTNTNTNFRFGSSGDSIYNVDVSGQSIDGYVSDYDYLYVRSCDSGFDERFGSLVDGGGMWLAGYIA